MKNDAVTPQTKYLKDYTPPDFKIRHIQLNFDIHPGATTVTARTQFEKSNKDAKNLVLDGQQLTLKSILLDGAPPSYTVTSDNLTVENVPDAFTLEIVTEIYPEKNTALEGLYNSGGNYCTQCEAEGFRKITYYLDRPDVMATFTTKIEAEHKICPVLLSNGNCLDTGMLETGRHFAVWEDPFPKPCYLFALVAGDLAHIHDTFTTMSGRDVDLYIYVNHGNQDKCGHAMKALKDSMRWDEEKYGREYDLNIFNIVAVDDFNMGAMENKSLNIFNSKLVLARPDTATDADYFAIESVIAHEYFHNWTGNRITCRDWFQLSLKEGLTVFRDQCFSADMHGYDVQRIDDVEQLRNIQFPEDAGPMAHPIRPDNYIEINNFYTPTVYEKGAEIIRMQHTLLGADNYRRGTDLYFQRHDGQAVTCDDFLQCMQDASGVDLSQFKLWYSQAGTPTITASGAYDAAAKRYTLTLSQTLPDTPGQKDKKPMHIPVAVGLLGTDGRDLLPEMTRILHLKEKQQIFTFDNIAEKPVPSILRRFSAPVKLQSDLSADDLLFLMAHDSDGFNRWDAGQTYLQRLMLDFVKEPKNSLPDAAFTAFGTLIADNKIDRALLAKALSFPSDAYLLQLMDTADIDGIYDARYALMGDIGKRYMKELKNLYADNADHGIYSPDAMSSGKRRLRAAALRLIQKADKTEATNLAAMQYKAATNMTDKAAALAVLADDGGAACKDAFAHFHADWKDMPLVLDKWFALQAQADRADVVEDVAKLLDHPDFTYKNPNRVRALVGTFSMLNYKWFHRKDGAGYRLLADVIIKLNGINPQIAARLLTPLRQWKRYDPQRKVLMENELRRIMAVKDISSDVYEIVSKSLN